ncbi:MAG: NAD(P)-binding domain-containing protein [Paludibacteraceae bacterium]|nr:NAD(P)-binding domain-containing protein [Paludibacteraceae bacterium]
MKIAFTTQLPKEGFERLLGHKLHVALSDADVLVSTFDYPVTRAMIESMPHLKLIANFGVGYNNIDLEVCKERGIRVTNTPQPVIEPTAELAFALMHAVARRTAELDRKVRIDAAEPFGVMNNLGRSLYGKTLGIIGLGRIGKAVARRAIASGMTIIYHNRHRLSEEEETTYQARLVTKEELLEQSDFMSLHLPYTHDSHHIIGAEQLKKMKKTAFLINTARGAHVDERALVKALQDGEIAGAAMDVYEFEPKISEELKTMDNVVLSPHVGTGTWDDRLKMCENVTDNILAFANGQENQMNIVL